MTDWTRHLRLAIAAPLIAASLAFASGPAGGEVRDPAAPAPYVEEIPPETAAAKLDQKLDGQLPLDLAFTDETGQTVRLGDYFRPGRPVVIQLGYYECPMLCSIISQGMLDAFKKQSLKIGLDYDVVIVSIDPKETWTLAQKKKRSYLASYDRPDEAAGWHLLTGNATSIASLADAIGFRYAWIERAQQYSHPAALVIATPAGRISRYLIGVKFDPQTLRLSLVEASSGKIGSWSDEFVLSCFMFDGTSGKYALSAMRLMRITGAATAMGLGLGLFLMFRRENRRAVAALSLPKPATEGRS